MLAKVKGSRLAGHDARSRPEARLDPRSGEPLYRQLAVWLAHRISNGELSVGAQVPTEAQLMASHGVSRITVRHAMALLVHNGQLIKRPGKGTFVTAPVMRHELGALQGFYDALREQGLEPRTELLDFSPSQGRTEQSLPVGLDMPVHLRRRYLLDGKPFAVVEAWLPQAAAGVGRDRAAQLTVFEIVERFLGERIASADVVIRCQLAPKGVADELGLRRQSSVLVMERCSKSVTGRPLEFMRIHIVPERYEFRLHVPGPLEIARSVRQSTRQPIAAAVSPG